MDQKDYYTFSPDTFISQSTKSLRSLFYGATKNYPEIYSIYKKMIHLEALSQLEEMNLMMYLRTDILKHALGNDYSRFCIGCNILLYRGKSKQFLETDQKNPIKQATYQLHTNMNDTHCIRVENIQKQYKKHVTTKAQRHKIPPTHKIDIYDDLYDGPRGYVANDSNKTEKKVMQYSYLEVIESFGDFIIGLNIYSGKIDIYNISNKKIIFTFKNNIDYFNDVVIENNYIRSSGFILSKDTFFSISKNSKIQSDTLIDFTNNKIISFQVHPAREYIFKKHIILHIWGDFIILGDTSHAYYSLYNIQNNSHHGDSFSRENYQKNTIEFLKDGKPYQLNSEGNIREILVQKTA